MQTKQNVKVQEVSQNSSLFSGEDSGRLYRERKFNYLIQPSSFHKEAAIDFWIHMEFSYSAHTAEVVVDAWWITDSMGNDISLSKIPYSGVQFLAGAMTKEYNYQVDNYYMQLEDYYYSDVKLKRAE